ncbi:MAG: tetratricopeptide repeat protein [Pirellulales bacterium]|nr:tetratricopeptide repeat protein [Pirellulales bacterium]
MVHRVLFGAVFLGLLTVVVYLPAIHGGFQYDDDLLLTANPFIKASDGLYWFWCTTKTTDCWPVTYTWLWTEWRLWGINPTGYHVVSLILHIGSCLLIWVILRRLSIPGAFLAALIFAVHPVNVQSVAWISQQKNLLAMLFFLLSILWYLKAEMGGESRDSRFESRKSKVEGQRSKGIFCSSILDSRPSTLDSRWYCASLLAFLLAMLSKGSVVVLPLLLLGIIWWRRKLTRLDFVRTAPFFALSVLLTGLNVWYQHLGQQGPIRDVSILQRVLGAGGVVWFYLYKAVCPLNLVFVYPQWRIQPGNPLWWLPLAAALAVTYVLWRYRNGWNRPLLFGWGFFCIALLPVMGLADVTYMRFSLVADHYQYIALIAVAALVAAGWTAWWRRIQAPKWRGVAGAALTGVVGALALLTWQQNHLYKNAEVMYRATIEKNPDCWMLHYNLAMTLLVQDQVSEAIQHYEQALRLNPRNVNILNNLGNALKRAGRLSEAIVRFRQALKLDPQFADCYNNLGNALRALGRQQEALDCYTQTLKFNPLSADARFNLGQILFETGKIPEAARQFQKALETNPNHAEAQFALANALDATGRLPEAVDHYKQALRLKPRSIESYNGLAITLNKLGRVEEALRCCQQALKIEPKSAATHNNLGLCLGQSGRFPEAIEHFQQALKLQPNFPEAENNLGNAFFADGQVTEAIKHYRQAVRNKPEFAEAYSNLGNALQSKGRTTEAVAQYRHALQCNPNNFQVHYRLGLALSESGQYQEAVKQFQETIRLSPRFLNAHINLAFTLAQADRPDEAVAAARKALDLARSIGETVMERQIEQWLENYQKRRSSNDHGKAIPSRRSGPNQPITPKAISTPISTSFLSSKGTKATNQTISSFVSWKKKSVT